MPEVHGGPFTRARPRALIVEDDPDFRGMVAELLERHGFDVYQTGEAAGAYELAVLIRPSVILLDIELPDGYGDDLARMLKRAPWTRSALLVAVTGRPELARDDDWEGAGFGAFFSKPFEPSALIDRLAARVEGLVRG
jgi:two-component system alkaline phosphatase synthesis response regulator PhoP